MSRDLRAYYLVREGVIPLWEEDQLKIQPIRRIIEKAQSRMPQNASWLNKGQQLNYDTEDRRRLLAQIRNQAIKIIPCILMGPDTWRAKIRNPAIGIRIITEQDEFAWKDYNYSKQRYSRTLVFNHQDATKLLYDQNLVSVEFVDGNLLRGNGYLLRILNGV